MNFETDTTTNISQNEIKIALQNALTNCKNVFSSATLINYLITSHVLKIQTTTTTASIRTSTAFTTSSLNQQIVF